MNLQLPVDTDLNAQAIESRPSTAPAETDVLLEMSVELWDQINRAAEMDGMTFDEFFKRHMWAVAKERLHREAERKRQAAEPKPDGRLRFPGAR